MDLNKTTIKRAFEIVHSGDVSNVEQIAAILRREGYRHGHFDGRALRKQFRGLIAAAEQTSSQDESC